MATLPSAKGTLPLPLRDSFVKLKEDKWTGDEVLDASRELTEVL